MRRLSLALGTACSLLVIPAASGQAAAGRKVELISMDHRISPPAASNAETEEGAGAVRAAFRVHDLSRQFVEFQMANDFAAMNSGLAAPDQYVADRVAPISSIAVPLWMRPGGSSFTPSQFVPGCAPLPYRPSGILGNAAEQRRETYYEMMSAIACEQGIPVGLFDAMIMRESSYNPLAVSPKNAFGLAQLMPGTAAGLGVNRFDAADNLRGGARYLRQQLNRFGQIHLALAAYNAGPGRVKGRVPRIPETQAYVEAILRNWSRISGYNRVAVVEQASKAPPRARPSTIGASVSTY